MAESKQTNEEEGKTEVQTIVQVQTDILHAFGDKDGKALMNKIEQNPLGFFNDDRPIAVQYAKLLMKPMNDNPLIVQLVKQVNDLKTRLYALECGFNETATNISLGTISYAPKLEFTVPNAIPDACKKILIYT